jgi:hypothetical protein
VIRVVEERFGEIDLGVKLVEETQCCDGSTEVDYRSESDDRNTSSDGGGESRGDGENELDSGEGLCCDGENEMKGGEDLCNGGDLGNNTGEFQKSGYCPEDNCKDDSDIPGKEGDDSTNPLDVIATDETNRVALGNNRVEIGTGFENFRDENRFFVLTEIESEEVGGDNLGVIEEVQGNSEEAQEFVEVEEVLARSNLIKEVEVGSCNSNEERNRQYRIEAESLFNIGLNMWVTTNADRILMMERLSDYEQKGDDIIEDWEDDEVDQ